MQGRTVTVTTDPEGEVMDATAGLLIQNGLKGGLKDVADAVTSLSHGLNGYRYMGTLNECAWIIAGGIAVAGLLIGAAIVGREILAARKVPGLPGAD